MNSISSIYTIARFEAKTLTRGWFFRIFAAITIVVLLLFNLFAIVAIEGNGASMRLMPGSVPYLNLYLLNIFQSVIAIFLSSDFLGRDKKLDTTESFYVRSVSNLGYVIGKTLGIGMVFIGLNIFVLLMGAIFNFIATDVDFIPSTYFIYPFILSFPSLLFILGMSFLLMVLTRNQAITFIIMLGLLGAEMFYLTDKFYGVFDFIGFSTPMAYSLFSGFSGINKIILIRGAYALTGIAFIFFTVYKLPRLPQEHYFKTRIISGIALTIIPAILMFFLFISQNRNESKLREDIMHLEATLDKTPSCIVNECDIQLTQKGSSLEMIARLKVRPITRQIKLILNPGFLIDQVKVDNRSIPFKRELNTFSFDVETSHVNSVVPIEIIYSGKPDNAASFPEISEDIRQSQNRLEMLVAGKEISFVKSSYVLLTRESQWYPVAASVNYRSQPQFTVFSLEASVNEGLTAFSQGNAQKQDNGSFVFKPSKPLNALSFVAGEYVVKSVVVDSVTINLAVHAKTMKGLNFFNEITDTIPSLIKEMKVDYERNMRLSYPFDQFNLIEVPIHFYSYPRSWTLTTEDNMPGQLFIVERGGGNRQADMKSQQFWVKQQSERQGEELLPKDLQVRLFKNVIGNTLFSSRGWMFSNELRTLTGWSKQLVFPQYFSFTNSISQSGFPIVQFITESQLFSRMQTSGGGGFGPNDSNNDQVILLAKGLDMAGILDSLKGDNRLTDLISRKGDLFFNTLQMKLKPKDIDDVIDSIINNNKHNTISIDEFINQFNNYCNSDIATVFSNWIKQRELPAFQFGDIKTFEVKEDNAVRYFIHVRVVNNGSDGILTIGLREQMRQGGGGGGPRDGGGGFGPGGGGFGGGPGMPSATVEETYFIAAGQQVEIGMFSNSEPREIIIDTYISENIPSSQRIRIDDISDKQVVPFEGMRAYSGKIILGEENEIIVDNEDVGFSTVNQNNSNTVKNWWMKRSNNSVSEDKYQSMNPWRPSSTWQPTLGDRYYGKYLKSAVYKVKGSGEAFAKWEAEISQSGNYSVYVYQSETRRRGGPGRREEQEKGSYSYTIAHDDGESVVESDVSGNSSGWIFLGDYYISQGKAFVELSDKTTINQVVADAVKWVKK